ncbi:beta-1,3-glucosyltransferase-like [Mytilus galloprovincialis]|uniref:beta-1,3-glucosyltransferase-like n=1 Tax=Mytilus galloprovincialis TaxID=29158 RepID=UPI003F7C0FDA
MTRRRSSDSILNIISIAICLLILCPNGLVKSEEEEDNELTADQIIFVVVTQPNKYHVSRAEEFKKHFKAQLTDIDKNDHPKLYFTHKEWDNMNGAWTFFPIFKLLEEDLDDKAWVFICEEDTRLDMQKLTKVLSKFDFDEDYILGHALQDQHATIIHHYAFHDNPKSFSYPDIGAGFALSNSLFTRIGDNWPDEGYRLDFSIDPKYELAKYIDNDGKGVKMIDIKQLCTTRSSKGCATWYPTPFPDCGKEIHEDKLFVAVKTCENFHKDRIPVVKATWGNTTTHIEYYSETEDPNIPTVDLGIPNTERGHCGKTMAIINRFDSRPEFKGYTWLLIADDDTIINLKRLRKLLACYDSKEPIHLGERYGYNVAKYRWGYDYITGGGGMLLSRAAVDIMKKNNLINCNTNESPDDMTLGMKLKGIGVPLTHTIYMHQARLEDYSPEFLRPRTHVSFHKHWMNDPYKVYDYLMKEPVEEPVTEEGHDEL